MAKPEPPYMTDSEAIVAVREGKRAVTEHSLFAATWVVPRECCNLSGHLLPNHGLWRTVACNFETDVVECNRCGKQRIAVCDFDDEFD